MSSDNSIAKFIIVTYTIPTILVLLLHFITLLLVLFPDHIFLTPAKSILVGTRLINILHPAKLSTS